MKSPWFFLLAFVTFLLLLLGLDSQAQPPPQKGVSYATWQPDDYSTPDADRSLVNLAATGADWISLIVTGYQSTLASTTISIDPNRTPTDDDLKHVIIAAHNLGLKVMLKPHVDVDTGQWRGEIGNLFTTEAKWADWFASYQNFIFHYASLAEAEGVDQFSVGTEFLGTSHRENDWRTVIAGVRARYNGSITYAANQGGEETGISWWDAVDYIGVDAYYPLTNKNDPTLNELKAGWMSYVDTLADLFSTWQKPILFTEVGYRSVDGANKVPWDFDLTGAVDLQEQADCYQATFESVFNQTWFGGMFWWVWSTDPFQGGACDDGYTPHDKPAEDVLRAWYGAPPRPNPQTLPSDYSQRRDIYTDELGADWQDWSWVATRNLAATDPVYSGTHAVSVTLGAYGALSFWHPSFDSSFYYWLEFYIYGSSGEEQLWAFFFDANGTELRKRPVDDCRYIDGGTIDRTWKRVRIPLSDLNAAEQSLTRIALQDRSGQAGTTFWIDEIRLVASTNESAGTVTFLNQTPALTWNYSLTHKSGIVSQWRYTGAAITGASVDGDALDAGWSVLLQSPTEVLFVATTPLTADFLTGFHITATAGGLGTWTAGSNSGSVEGALPVERSTFTATVTQDGIRLKWQTESETNNLGFHVYRSRTKEGEYVRITPRLIKGHGTDATSHDYSFVDDTAEAGHTYWYRIEDVDFSGKTDRSAPIEVVFHPQTVSVEVLPTSFALHQNYPNPFNPETWIGYDLAKAATVEITIYTAFGHPVRRLQLGLQPAGIYQTKQKAAYWDGRDDSGERVASGVYFYNLTAGDYSATRRLTVLK